MYIHIKVKCKHIRVEIIFQNTQKTEIILFSTRIILFNNEKNKIRKRREGSFRLFFSSHVLLSPLGRQTVRRGEKIASSPVSLTECSTGSG